VVVVIAMEAEASPFIEHLNLEASEDFFPPQTPFKAFSGPHNGCHVTVVTNGKDHAHGA
jgi:5'-methylthioadenosine nucleosidase